MSSGRRSRVLSTLLAACAFGAAASAASAGETREISFDTPGGSDLSQQIFGGLPAPDGSLSFNVFVTVRHGGGTIACSGSVVGRGWVLTAAHCLTDETGAFLPGLSGIDITGGVTDLNDATPANIVAVNSAVISVDYAPPINGFANDWAILRLDAVPATDGLPLARADRGPFDSPGIRATLSGFGLVGEVPPVVPSVLQVGTAPILGDADCTTYFGSAHVPGLMTCTGPPPFEAPVDATTCPGDSGGPLFVPFGTGFLQSGITSFGPEPCEAARIGGYTKVSAYAAELAVQIGARDSSIGAPVAATGGVAATHADGLTVEGVIDANSLATSIEVEWGTTPALGQGFARGYAGMGQDPEAVTARITGAPADTTIHYRVTGISAAGVSEGDILNGRTTTAPPPQTPSGDGTPPGGGAQQPTEAALPRCAGLVATMVGTDGPDVLTGTGDRDVIVGLGGNDLINGLGGADVICPDDGDDVVDAGPGDDHVAASGGDDQIRGNAGDDDLAGGPGADDVRGGPGSDAVTGGPGQDRLRGGAGIDSLLGGTGADVLRADGGADMVFGGTGADTLRGDDGDDQLRGGPGRDLILGGRGADLALGKTSNDRIFGGPGNDALFGNEGNDRLVGNAGRDRGVGGKGRDVCDTERRSHC
ncbi:MAG: trypsin-like serine protease [Miltoncostaeaceae bacterium]